MNNIDINSLWNSAICEGGSIAMWRLPHDAEFHFLADVSGNPAKGSLNLAESPFGFAVSPFLNSAGTKTIFLSPDVYSVFVEEDLQNTYVPLKFHCNKQDKLELSGSRIHFLEMVQKGLAEISAGIFAKIVLAGMIQVDLRDDFNVIGLFAKMSKAHPDAFVSLVSIPDVGTWLGASPELLVELSDEQFRTVSLAGTQPYIDGMALSAAVWAEKEIEEQAMVSRYIVEQFKTIRLREFVESGPATVRAGRMIHLKTEYCVVHNNALVSNLGSIMLRLLHPTSAVCGMPREEALDFIVANEEMERGLYSGYLGPVNMDGRTQLYVNLRCMQICGKNVAVYAGAGVTHDSLAENEWAEVMLKFNSLLDIIGS